MNINRDDKFTDPVYVDSVHFMGGNGEGNSDTNVSEPYEKDGWLMGTHAPLPLFYDFPSGEDR
ncbi:MAG: hypothetical protein OXI44_05935 [Bacteroidota bacterium]|nr:hypothetical protein [Bacteroidota bacterium]